MNNRTKAVAIPQEVKKRVEERDNHCCIFCGSPNARGEAHVIGRAQGGLGIEENLITTCRYCHNMMDNSWARDTYVNKAKEYLKAIYPGWDEKKYIYDKWGGLKFK